MNHEDFLRRAIKISYQKMMEGQGGPFGCVIVKNGNIIAEGWNTVTSSNDPTAHAEVNAIRKACQSLGSHQLSDCILYTSCEPCPMCLGAIYWARPDKVYFAASKKDAADAGFDDSFIYQELELDHSNRKIPMIQLLQSEAQISFKAWIEKEDKSLY